MATTVKDIVCGMDKKSFDENPEKYLGKEHEHNH